MALTDDQLKAAIGSGQLLGLKKLATLLNSTFAAAGGLAVRGGSIALDGANPTPVVTGLTTVTAFVPVLQLATVPGVGTSSITSGAPSGGTVNIYGWKVTSSSDNTLIASAGTENVTWIAVGVA